MCIDREDPAQEDGGALQLLQIFFFSFPFFFSSSCKFILREPRIQASFLSSREGRRGERRHGWGPWTVRPWQGSKEELQFLSLVPSWWLVSWHPLTWVWSGGSFKSSHSKPYCILSLIIIITYQVRQDRQSQRRSAPHCCLSRYWMPLEIMPGRVATCHGIVQPSSCLSCRHMSWDLCFKGYHEHIKNSHFY